MEGTSLRRSRNPCWVQQCFWRDWRRAFVCWISWTNTGIESSFFQMKKLSPFIMSSTNRIIRWYHLELMSLNIAECQQQSIQPQYHDTFRSSIEREEDASGFVWRDILANLCAVQDDQKDERKQSETLQESLFSAAPVQKRLEKRTRLSNDLKK